MTEAPERIWATGNGQTGSWNDHEINPKHAPHQTEYTRKDVSDALVAAAREEALREALAECDSVDPTHARILAIIAKDAE